MLNCSFTWMTTGSTPSTSSYCLHHYLRHSPPVSHLRLQTHDLCRQPVDLLLRPDDVTEVHLIAVEALMGPWVLWQVRGNRRGGSGWGSSGDWQHCGTDGGGLSRMLQLLEFFLEPALPSLQVTDLHLGTDANKYQRPVLPLTWASNPHSVLTRCVCTLDAFTPNCI